MSPKRPTRPKTDTPDTTPVVRDTTPDTPTPPRLMPDTLIDPTLTHPVWQLPAPPVTRREMIEIYDLPAETHIRDSTVQRPIGSYFLAPGLVNRLPPPDLLNGIRSAGRHAYVDLVEGGTVQIGPDAQTRCLSCATDMHGCDCNRLNEGRKKARSVSGRKTKEAICAVASR
jgi:hypothetical protein